MNTLPSFHDATASAMHAVPGLLRRHTEAASAGTPSDLECGVLIQALDEIDYGVMLVTCAGFVRHANRVALRQCAASRCIRLDGGCVEGSDEHTDRRLRQAIFGAMAGRRCLLTVPDVDSTLSIAVVPLTDIAAVANAGVVMLVLGRRQVCETLSVDFFARAHGITAAEMAVLRALCHGVAPTKLATQTGVALCTIRSQISSLRLKTGTKNIGELVRMVTVLPPIVAVLN